MAGDLPWKESARNGGLFDRVDVEQFTVETEPAAHPAFVKGSGNESLINLTEGDIIKAVYHCSP